jgi:uncharacterized membrane protein YgcG
MIPFIITVTVIAIIAAWALTPKKPKKPAPKVRSYNTSAAYTPRSDDSYTYMSMVTSYDSGGSDSSSGDCGGSDGGSSGCD